MQERFAEFRQQYEAELDGNAAVQTFLELAASSPRVTLLYAAGDPQVNHAVVLRDFLLGRADA
jgi:DNA-3-methyladenine glycosylase